MTAPLGVERFTLGEASSGARYVETNADVAAGGAIILPGVKIITGAGVVVVAVGCVTVGATFVVWP